MFSSVTSWLGVGQRPKEEDENKENDTYVHSESKDSISSTSVETSVSSKAGLTETEESEGDSKASTTSESTPDTNPLDALEDVSAKALSTAKEFGNMLFSFGKAAGKTMADTAVKIKHTVEDKTMLGDFTREQDKFVTAKKEKCNKEEAGVAPWIGYNEEENLKTQILALSQDKRNFVRNPPAGVQFQFDFESSYPVALATLQEDQNLQKMRFDLVPKVVNEEAFWRNYFYRVSLIRQSSQLASSLAHHSGKSSTSSSRRSSTGSEHKESGLGKEKETEPEVIVGTSPGQDEFVSDAFGESQFSEEDLRKEMEQQLRVAGTTSDADKAGDDWERELQQELQEYELVGGVNDEDEDDALEKEILQQIEQEANSLAS